MKRQIDEDLNLEQLLARCKEMEPWIVIRIYFDPHTFLFHIEYADMMSFFLPPGVTFIGQCQAEKARLEIEIFIGGAIRMLTKLKEA